MAISPHAACCAVPQGFLLLSRFEGLLTLRQSIYHLTMQENCLQTLDKDEDAVFSTLLL